MAFRNSLLLIAFFLVATTSVGNCQVPGIPNIPGVPTVIAVSAILPNITAVVGELEPLPVVNVTLNCSGALMALPAVESNNGAFLIVVPYQNATQINSSCILSANVSIGGVPNTITWTILSLADLVLSVFRLFLAVLDVAVVDGILIKLTV